MIKSKEYKNKGIEIDLTGPQGNAYYLLGLASKWSKELQFSDSYREEMLEKMKKGFQSYHILSSGKGKRHFFYLNCQVII